MIWRQVRLAGTVMCVVSAIFNVPALSFIGLLIIFIGITGAVDRLEKDFDERQKEKYESIN